MSDYWDGRFGREGKIWGMKPSLTAEYADLADHFRDFDIMKSGLIEDPEDHGDEGPHVHMERFILVTRRKH